MKKKPNWEQFFSFAFLLVTLGVVLYIGFSGNDIEMLLHTLRTFSPAALAVCLLSWILYLCTHASALYCFLRRRGFRVRYLHCLHASMTGIYYSNITPGASGGQPMEIYRLSRYGVPIGISGSGMAMKYIMFQVVLLATGAVFWLTHGSFVAAHTEGSMWFIVLGYIVNFFSIAGVALMAISQRAVRFVIDLCIRLGVKVRLCRNPEATRAKWEEHCRSFLYSFRLVLNDPLELFLQCLIAFAQIMALMVPIIATYYAFGLREARIGELITMGVLLYISASYTPLPGASGAQEGGFAVLFQGIFPDASLFVALLIWRFSTYYLSILAGAAMTVWESIHGMRSGGRKPTKAGEGVSDESSK